MLLAICGSFIFASLGLLKWLSVDKKARLASSRPVRRLFLFLFRLPSAVPGLGSASLPSDILPVRFIPSEMPQRRLPLRPGCQDLGNPGDLEFSNS